jgi:uncharacterized lipoprotein YmbA
VVSLAVISFLLAATNGSGTNLVLLFAGMGGFTGFAAGAAVIVNWVRNKQVAKVENKSVAITELEKAVPGLGDIIEQWQAVVHQLQSDLAECRESNVSLSKRVAELEGAAE